MTMTDEKAMPCNLKYALEYLRLQYVQNKEYASDLSEAAFVILYEAAEKQAERYEQLKVQAVVIAENPAFKLPVKE